MIEKERSALLLIDEVNDILNEIAQELPDIFWKHLNGGVVLSPDFKLHEADKSGNLYTLGEYHNDRQMGRYIVIYYESFARVYGQLSPQGLRVELKRVLIHEFTHHVESLAGEAGLEIKDAEDISEYLRKFNQL